MSENPADQPPNNGEAPTGNPGHAMPPPGYPPNYTNPNSQAPYGPAGYGTPPNPYTPYPYGPPAYGYGPVPQPQYPYGPQFGWYADPADPLVSPDFGGWWNRAFTLLAAVWRPMVMVQLIWALPLVLLSVLLNLAPVEAETSTNVEFTGEIAVALLVTAGAALATMLLSLVTQLATMQILVQRATGRPVSVGEALMTGLRRAPAMLGWGILAGLLIAVGLLLCVLPGLYVSLVLLVLSAVVLLERGKGIGRAFELFHADFGAALGRVATIVGIMVAFSLVTNVFSGLLLATGQLSDGGMDLVPAAAAAIISIVSSILVSPLLLTAYADMRARHEPFSTAHLAGASV